MSKPEPVSTRELTVVAERHEDALFAGLRQNWVDGSGDNGLVFDLATGAGLGSPYLTLTVIIDGETIIETIDVSPLLQSWVDAIRDEREESQ